MNEYPISDIPLSIDTNPVETEPKLSLDTTPVTTPLNPEDAKKRAAKAEFALTDTGVDINRVVTDILNGNEDSVREQAATHLNAQDQAKRAQVIQDLINSKEGPLDPKDITSIKGTTPIPYTKDDVIERKAPAAAVALIDDWTSDKDENFWTIYKKTAPPAFETLVEAGSDNIARHMYIQKLKMQNQAQFSQQSFLGQATDVIKQFFPLHTELKNRNNVEGVGFLDGIFSSENIKKQREALMTLPWPKFIEEVNRINTDMKQGVFSEYPLAAAHYWDKILGQDPTEMALDNLNTLGTVLDVVGIGQVAKGGYSITRLHQLSKQAMRDIREATTNYNATKADIIAATGDIGKAGVEEAAVVIEKQLLSGDVKTLSEGLDRLPRFFDLDMANIRNSSAISETQKNILLEQYEYRKSAIMKALSLMIRPERVPISKASREILTAIQETTKARYPSLSNYIHHISDPQWVPLSNTYTMTLRVGKSPSELFTSEMQAVNFARNNGLHVSLNPDQLTVLKNHIKELEEQVAHPPRMDDDVHGLNRYYDLKKELEALKHEMAVVSRPGGYAIEQTGTGFHINVTANLKETDKIIRNFLSTDEKILNPKTGEMMVNPNYRPESQLKKQRWIGSFTGSDWWRTAEDTFGQEARQARKAATYGQAVLYGIVREEAQFLKDLSRGVVRYDPVTGEQIPWYKAMFKHQPGSSRNVFGMGHFMKKDEWEAFKESLVYSQKALDKDGVPGRYFETPDELNYYYMHVHDRLPSFVEKQAYFAVKRWDEIDRVLREVSLYRNFARLGAETHAVKIMLNGEEVTSEGFAGISMSTIPRGRSNLATVDKKNLKGKGVSEVKNTDDLDNMHALLIGGNGEVTVEDLARLTPKKRDEYHRLLKEGGYKLIRIADPERRPLRGFVENGDLNIEYILAKNIETSPLKWEQVPRRGGGHQVYDYDNFIKQATIRSERIGGTLKHRYEGDVTWAPVEIRAMGEDIAGRLNVFRKLLRDEKFDEAEKYASRWFDEPYAEMKARFYPKKDEKGVMHPALFNLEEDFKVVPRSRSIIDIDKNMVKRYKDGFRQVPRGTFIDGTREGSLMRNFQVEYTGERDARGLFTYKNEGTVENPVYKTTEADRLNPLDVLNRATSRIINSTLMDDYKIYAVESWIREATPYLKVLGSNDELITSSPFFYFKHPEWIAGTPVDVKSRLMAARYKIDQLVGTPSFAQTWAHSQSQNLVDMTYKTFGNKSALVPLWLIDKVGDGPSFLRSLAFHTQLGLFNTAQLAVQAMSLVNLAAISPRFAASATWAGSLYQYSRFTRNEAVLNYLDNMATKMKIPGLPQWKPGEWKEARDTFARSGFKDVGGEWGPLDVMRQTKTLTGPGGSFLHAGTFPMREGEKLGRIGAWFTAFKEFRDKNPLSKIGNSEMAVILDRADLLYNNMSVASHSFINNPLLSLTTQFYSYAIHLGEMFFSKRIGETVGERTLTRARLLMANMFMFGMPMAPGVTATPLNDTIRQMAVEHGFGGVLTKYSSDNPGGPYIVDRNRKGAADWIDHFMMEGGPATAFAIATGEHPNFGERMGSGGMGPMRDLVFGDSSFWKWVGGVSGQVAYNTLFNNTQGLFDYFRYMFNKSATGLVYDANAKYELKLTDLTDLVKEAQIANKTEAAIVALNTGKWVSKNGDIVKDIGPFAAVMYALTGMRPQDQSDARHIQVTLKAKLEAQKEGLNKLEKNINDYILAEKAGNPEQAQDFMRRGLAVVVGYDLAPDQIAHAISRYFKKNEYSMIENIAFNRFITHGSKTDPVLREKQQKAYQSIRQATQKLEEDK